MFLPPQSKIKLIKTISEAGDTIMKFTQPKYFNSNEINSQEGTYKEREANINFRSFQVVIQPKGLNPSRLSYKTNFSKDILEHIAKDGQGKNYENLNKEVLRDYLVINKEELNRFNNDFSLNM